MPENILISGAINFVPRICWLLQFHASAIATPAPTTRDAGHIVTGGRVVADYAASPPYARYLAAGALELDA